MDAQRQKPNRVGGVRPNAPAARRWSMDFGFGDWTGCVFKNMIITGGFFDGRENQRARRFTLK